MSSVEHQLSEFILHRLRKAGEHPASVELRAHACRPDAVALALMERLFKLFADRSSKGFGCFEDDVSAYPMPALVREYVLDGSLDLVAASHRMMEVLQVQADEAELEAGGVMLVARVREGAGGTNERDTLWFALVGETIGCATNAGLDVVECTHLDLSALRAAGRIDLTGWQRGDERYISFLKGRGDATWFRRFLGCSDVVVALKETRRLVQALGDFVESERLEVPQRDALLERAHAYLDELGESGEPLVLEEVAREVAREACPEHAERLDAALRDESTALASGFVPNRRALRPLVRFSASNEQWKLEFERGGLRSGMVRYDPGSDTLVLSGLPDYLRKMLAEEGTGEARD